MFHAKRFQPRTWIVTDGFGALAMDFASNYHYYRTVGKGFKTTSATATTKNNKAHVISLDPNGSLQTHAFWTGGQVGLKCRIFPVPVKEPKIGTGGRWLLKNLKRKMDKLEICCIRTWFHHKWSVPCLDAGWGFRRASILSHSCVCVCACACAVSYTHLTLPTSSYV